MNHLLQAGLAGALLLGAAASAQAQTTVSFGPRLGGNLSTFSYNHQPEEVSATRSRLGVQVGATLNVDFGNNLAFQPSLLFSQKGAELQAQQQTLPTSPIYTTIVNVTVRPQLNYLELPLNMVYTSGGDHGFQLFLGPYAALGVGGGGSYTVDVKSVPNNSLYDGTYSGALEVVYGSNDRTDNNNAGNSTGAPVLQYPARRFDAGLNGGVGYRVGPVQAQVGYSLGLLNFVPNDSNGNDTGNRAYNRGFQLAATYFFTKDSFRRK